MNAWGRAWGNAWGNSWGPLTIPPANNSTGGGGGSATYAWKRRNRKELTELLEELKAGDAQVAALVPQALAELSEVTSEAFTNLSQVLHSASSSNHRSVTRYRQFLRQLETLQEEGELLAVFFLL